MLSCQCTVETQDLQCITIIVVFDVYPLHTPLELSRSLLCFSVMVRWYVGLVSLAFKNASLIIGEIQRVVFISLYFALELINDGGGCDIFNSYGL